MRAGLLGRGITVSDVSGVALWASVVSCFVAGAAIGAAGGPKLANKMGR